MKPRRSLEIRDLVLIADENVNRGKDGYVRSAKVQTSLTVLIRAVAKLCFLEGQKAAHCILKKRNPFFSPEAVKGIYFITTNSPI